MRTYGYAIGKGVEGKMEVVPETQSTHRRPPHAKPVLAVVLALSDRDLIR